MTKMGYGTIDAMDLSEEMLEMESDSQWTLQEPVEDDYLIKEDVTAKFFTYQVNAV